LSAPSRRKILYDATVGTGVLLLCSLTCWLLWNRLLAALFHAPQITFWQSAALLIIRNILCTTAKRFKKETP